MFKFSLIKIREDTEPLRMEIASQVKVKPLGFRHALSWKANCNEHNNRNILFDKTKQSRNDKLCQ